MPTLTWVGKEKVVNHHHEVPFRVLNKEYTFRSLIDIPNSMDNRIIRGDNLEALKSLLPEFESRVKCIYIDPPYNTGNESWIYNDNVNDPKITKWLGQVVGKQGEDLSRHDKWLCMMYPRLKLLRSLLREDGAIFVSCDDHEQHHLRMLMDEIFGEGNFVSTIIWQKKYSSANDHKSIAPMHDFILVYQKSSSFRRNLLPRTEEKDRQYRFEDERGVFRPDNYTCNKTADERPNLYYPILNPNTGEEIWPKRTSVWRYSKERHEQNVADGLVYWGKDGTGKVPAFKRYRSELRGGGGIVPNTWWTFEFAGHTDGAKKEIRNMDIGEGALDFITPKPTRLIERILQIATDKDSIVLDSFAGSGTTAHAVLNLNAQDGGQRRFILIEMMDYAETITAERVRLATNGYGEGNKRVEGIGGGFEYYTVGEPLFLDNENLNEAVGLKAIRDYVRYSEAIPDSAWIDLDEPRLTTVSPYLLGINEETAWLFNYEPNQATCLDMEFLSTLRFGDELGIRKPSTTVIYADRCLLSNTFMTKHGIVFKKIPRDITRF